MAKHDVPISTFNAQGMLGRVGLLKRHLQNLQSILKTFQINAQANFDLNEEEFTLNLLRLSYDELDDGLKNVSSLEEMLALTASPPAEGRA